MYLHGGEPGAQKGSQHTPGRKGDGRSGNAEWYLSDKSFPIFILAQSDWEDRSRWIICCGSIHHSSLENSCCERGLSSGIGDGTFFHDACITDVF